MYVDDNTVILLELHVNSTQLLSDDSNKPHYSGTVIVPTYTYLPGTTAHSLPKFCLVREGGPIVGLLL
jgi:hypothetical protein